MSYKKLKTLDVEDGMTLNSGKFEKNGRMEIMETEVGFYKTQTRFFPKLAADAIK